MNKYEHNTCIFKKNLFEFRRGRLKGTPKTVTLSSISTIILIEKFPFCPIKTLSHTYIYTHTHIHTQTFACKNSIQSSNQWQALAIKLRAGNSHGIDYILNGFLHLRSHWSVQQERGGQVHGVGTRQRSESLYIYTHTHNQTISIFTWLHENTAWDILIYF